MYNIQGFFIKENSYERNKANFELNFNYWLESKHPKSIASNPLFSMKWFK